MRHRPLIFLKHSVLNIAEQQKKEHNRNMKFDPQTLQNSKLQAAKFSPSGPALSFGDKRIDDIFHGGLNSHAMHEIYGPAAVSLTSMILSLTTGTIIWIRPKNQPRQLNPNGIFEIKNNINKYITVYSDLKQILWATEQTARSGACNAVVAEIERPPNFIASRRLQLIARAHCTLVIILSHDEKNIVPSAAETRLRATSTPTSGHGLPRFHINLFKNKNSTNLDWEMEWHDPTNRFSMVSLHSNRSNYPPSSNMAR
jgi:hypothetical protein